jgi:adenylate cyclase
MFGAEVNLASKLGEDLANRDEILLTAEAYQRLDQESRECEERLMKISGLELNVHKVKYDVG